MISHERLGGVKSALLLDLSQLLFHAGDLVFELLAAGLGFGDLLAQFGLAVVEIGLYVVSSERVSGLDKIRT